MYESLWGFLTPPENNVVTSLVPRLLCVGRGKKKSLDTVCACSVPPGFLGILEISVNSIRYTNLCKTCRPFPRERCLALTTLCVDDDEGGISSSLTASEITYFI